MGYVCPIKTISVEEQKTWQLFAVYLNDETKWSSHKQIIANIFNAHHTSAYTLDQIHRIACALNSYESIDLKDAVRELVRAKVLRSRPHSYYYRGNRVTTRIYEVNY